MRGCRVFFFFLKIRRPPGSTLFPYTTLFRSDFQNISYYSAPKAKKKLESLDDVDPEVLRTFEKLGIPLEEQKKLSNVAVDAVFDSVSVATTHKKKLMEVGIIFCSFSEAVKDYPELIKEYLGTVVPIGDNYYAALNSAVFTDGSFVYIPPDTISPMELSTYFRINTEETGQFERTLIICAENSYVSYLEGCTAPQFDTNQLHAAVVELVTLDNAEIKYSTVQNWYSGDPETGKGGIYNFVTKRGKCQGKNSKISWTQVETGSAITWKYPSCILQGDDSVGEFYSVALTNGYMQADTGSKMMHIGKNTRSSIPAARRILFEVGQQRAQPGGCVTGCFEGATARARTIAGQQRRAGGAETPGQRQRQRPARRFDRRRVAAHFSGDSVDLARSEEHTSELQSQA